MRRMFDLAATVMAWRAHELLPGALRAVITCLTILAVAVSGFSSIWKVFAGRARSWVNVASTIAVGAVGTL